MVKREEKNGKGRLSPNASAEENRTRWEKKIFYSALAINPSSSFSWKSIYFTLTRLYSLIPKTALVDQATAGGT